MKNTVQFIILLGIIFIGIGLQAFADTPPPLLLQLERLTLAEIDDEEAYLKLKDIPQFSIRSGATISQLLNHIPPKDKDLAPRVVRYYGEKFLKSSQRIAALRPMIARAAEWEETLASHPEYRQKIIRYKEIFIKEYQKMISSLMEIEPEWLDLLKQFQTQAGVELLAESQRRFFKLIESFIGLQRLSGGMRDMVYWLALEESHQRLKESGPENRYYQTVIRALRGWSSYLQGVALPDQFFGQQELQLLGIKLSTLVSDSELEKAKKQVKKLIEKRQKGI
jgi:hypothetical protein